MKPQITPRPKGGGFSKVIAAAALGLAAMPAFGVQDGPYCQDYPQTTGTWTQTKDLPQFNKPGTLTKVTITLQVDVAGSSLAIQNTAANTVSASSDVKLFFTGTVGAPANVPPLLNTLVINDSAGQFVGTMLAGDNNTGPLYSPPDGVVLSVSGTDSQSKTYTAPADNLSQFVGVGTIPIVVQVIGASADVSGGNFLSQFTALSSARACVTYEYEASSAPGISLLKSASKLTLDPFEKCTYTYTVQNAGGVPLTGITVKDDNGTPGFAGDDFFLTGPVIDDNGTPGTVLDDFTIPGPPFDLAVGHSARLTATVIPPICLDGVLSTGPTVNAGILIPQILPNGDVKVIFLQDFGVNDNTYGTGMVGWVNNSHTFGNLTGSDKLEFRFFDAANNVVMDVYLDTISQISGVTWAGGSYTYPSGYGTYGPFGAEGSFVQPFSSATDGSKIVAFWTSISENLNIGANLPNKAALIVNSPTSDDGNGNPVVNLLKAPGGWESINIYSCTVKGSIFDAGGGFGKVTIPDQHNSPAKQGGHVIVPFPVPCNVTNTALAHTVTAGGLDATGKAVVAIGTGGGGGLNGWISGDVGRPKKKGSSSITGTPPNESFSIDGGGKNIGGGDDQFQYLYQAGTGNCSITAKVLTIEKTENHALAGVDIRESLDKDSKHFGMFVTAADGIHLECRGASPSETKITGPTFKAPYWVRVTRTNNTFTGEYSTDGTTWVLLGTRTIVMTTGVDVGLGVCSHKDGELCTSTFDNVTLVP